jgi:flagellar basal-body rod protein FlgC
VISSILSNSLSGLRAAGTRVLNSAENISNAGVTGRLDVDGNVTAAFQPRKVVQTSVQGGGVETQRVPISPASVQVYAPDVSTAGPDGTVAWPNVSIASEAVHLVQADTAYRASLKVMQTADDMLGELLDKDS